MTNLALATRNMLAQQPSVRGLGVLGRSTKWSDGWIFADKPFVVIENTGRALIVITQAGSWQTSNPHNTMKFPRIRVDVWADPDRNPDKTPKEYDADDKIQEVFKHIDSFLHTVNLDEPGGKTRIWGTASEVATKSGVTILSSQRLDGDIEYFDVADGNHARMGTMYYGVKTFDTF